MQARANQLFAVVLPRAIALGILLLCATSGSAQTSLEEYAGLGCKPVDENRKSIYISYDDVKSDSATLSKDSKPKVWLRLHNNLTCGIRVPTQTVSEMTLPDGKTTVEVLQDDAQASIIYYVQDYKQQKAPKAASEFDGSHIIHWPILPSGKSITFGVPLEQFRKKLNVVIIFVYTWEGFNSPSLMHQVYFLNDRLPKAL